MKRRIEYTPSQVKTFEKFKEILIKYGKHMEVKIDQQDSYYLAFPNYEVYGAKAGTLFAAIQIMKITVDLYLPLLMNKTETLPDDMVKELIGYLDPKGVIHAFHFREKFFMEVDALVKFSADRDH